MDIDLAIEKLMVVDYIKTKPEIIHPYTTAHPKVAPIQGFYTIPYIIDFGVVITGSTVRYFIYCYRYMFYCKCSEKLTRNQLL